MKVSMDVGKDKRESMSVGIFIFILILYCGLLFVSNLQ